MISALLSLEVDDEELVKRLLKRGETSGRADDNDEGVIRNRIDVYKSETTPVFEYYNRYGISKKIEGIGTIEEITERLVVELNKLQNA